MACPHGYDPRSCLICRTLDPAPPRTASRRRRRDAASGTTGGRGRVEVLAPGATARAGGGGGRTAVHVAALVGVLVLAVLSFGLVTSVLFAVLRVLELVVVAGAASAVAYRVGRARGRRER